MKNRKAVKNKKAFSLVELLAVTVILAILLIIATPQIVKYVNKGKVSYYNSIEKEMNVAGADYMEDYRAFLPQHVGHVNEVALEDLVDSKYIDSVKDEKGNLCTGKVIVERTKKDSYSYYSCLYCGSYYQTEDTNCEKSVSNNKYADSSEYSIVVDPGPYIAFLSTPYETPMATVYHNGEPYEENGSVVRINGTPKKITPHEVKEYPVVYYYHGVTETIEVEIEDNTKPSAVSVVLRRNNETGKIYKKDWSNDDLYAIYKATDYSTKGVVGSGIDHYEISTDGISFTSIIGDHELLETEGDYTRYVRAVDKRGNVGEAVTFNYKIDKTPPTCTWSGESTVWQPNLNLPEEQRIYDRTIVATCHDSVSDCMDRFKTKSWFYDYTIKTDENMLQFTYG